jgi:hypothetical protein
MLMTEKVPMRPASRTGGLQPCLDALSDEVPLKLGECTENMEDELATGGRAGNAFGQGFKVDAPAFEGGQRLSQVGE